MTELFDPFQADLLRAAFLHHDEAVPAWQRWRDSVDWEGHLDPEAFALLPVVYRNLHRLGFDDPLFPRIKGIMRQSWLHNQQRIAALDDTLVSFALSQIEVLLLPPTSLWLTDRTAVLSPALPHQLAVPLAQAEQTIRHLHATGWRSPHVSVPSAMLPGYVRGARHLFVENGDRQSLTLTWGLESWFADRGGEVWRRARTAEFGRHTVRALDPTDAFEFALRQTEPGTWLRRTAAALTMHSAAERIEWTRLLRELHSNPLPVPWADALRFMQMVRALPSAPSVELAECCGERPAATNHGTVERGWVARASADWAAYRGRWGDDSGTPTVLLQLPGFLMGRWHLAGLAQLPRGLWRWLRYKKGTP